MPVNKSVVTKVTRLNLTGISLADRADAKQEVLDFLVEQSLVDFSKAKSPVTGRGFKPLSKEYLAVKAEFTSSRKANMEQRGDMLDAFEGKLRAGNQIEVGFFESSQAIKAFNHNRGDTLPKRQLVPEAKQRYRAGIRAEVEGILEGFRDAGDD